MPLNNRIDNLEIINASEHHKKHWNKKRAKELSILGHKARWEYESIV